MDLIPGSLFLFSIKKKCYISCHSHIYSFNNSFGLRKRQSVTHFWVDEQRLVIALSVGPVAEKRERMRGLGVSGGVWRVRQEPHSGLPRALSALLLVFPTLRPITNCCGSRYVIVDVRWRPPNVNIQRHCFSRA